MTDVHIVMNCLDLRCESEHLIIVLHISISTAAVHKDNDITWDTDVDT